MRFVKLGSWSWSMVLVKKGPELMPLSKCTHQPPTPQLLNIDIQVKRQEKGPEEMLCCIQANNQPEPPHGHSLTSQDFPNDS